MPAAAPIIASIITTGALTAIEMNQQKKAQEGAQNAAKDQQNQVDKQLSDQKKKEQDTLYRKQTIAGSSQKAAIDAIRASMTTAGGMGGTILTGSQGATAAPTQSKALLGV